MNKKPITAIFLGTAGSGKGKQAQLLTEHLGKDNTIYTYCGREFRNLVEKEKTLTSRLLKEKVIDIGNIAPGFLAIWAWGSILIKKVTPDSNIIFDGSPRSIIEAEALLEALHFYGREKSLVFVLEISDEEIFKRLKKRAREDDIEKIIEKRIKWYKENTPKILSYLESDKRVKIIKIDAMHPIEDVFNSILSHIN